MIDFRQYKDLIRKTVAEENAKDPNWKWSVKSISKSKVAIRWSYLEGEQVDCFFIQQHDDGVEDDWLFAKTPRGQMIECYMVAEVPNPNIGAEQSIKSGIREAIHDIAHYAHTRY